MPGLLLVLDQGTTGSQVAFFDADTLSSLAQHKVEFPQRFPQPGWVEHDADDIWNSTLAALTNAWAALSKSFPKATLSDVRAIGITNQRESCLAWNKRTGELAGNVLVWQDRRTAEACLALKRDEPTRKSILERTGLVCDPYFSATKMQWILANQAKAKAWTASGELALGTIDSFLLFRLTGGKEHATDHTNASRTMLYNLTNGTWDAELTARFGIPQAALPRIQASIGPFGKTSGAGPLPDGIPITGILGDQQSALFGHGCDTAGEAKITYGTGAFLLMHIGDKPAVSDTGLLTTVAASFPDGTRSFALEGAAFIAGAAVQFLRDQFQWFKSASDSEALALSEARDPALAFVPAFTGLAAPHWNPNARAALLGLTRGSTRAQVTRAVTESIALQNVELLALMQAASGRALARVAVDGGATSNAYLMQFQADVLQALLIRPADAEITARGAARAAWLGLDAHANAPATARAPQTFTPRMPPEEAQKINAHWQRAAAAIDAFHRT